MTMDNIKNLIYICLVINILLIASCKSTGQKEAKPENKMQWWEDAKFGLFIHWGVYSVPAGMYRGKEIDHHAEWIFHAAKIPVAEYRKFAGQFNPVKYDPEAWVKLVKNAGMKYIIITSKHHDGFALFDSKVTDWDVVDATPYGKDLLRPLAEACRKEGIRLGFYYSHAQDWYHPGGQSRFGQYWDDSQPGDMDDYLDNIAVPQVKEILSNYGKIDILWWDFPINMTQERADKFLAITAGCPDLITNNRLGPDKSTGGDYQCSEQRIPSIGSRPGRPWETCMTMNRSWGYKSFDHNWKSAEDMIHKLSDIVSKGGNFLLNVGPTAEGEIPQPSIERLYKIGEWMHVNSEAIYGTDPNPFLYLPLGRATLKGQKLFLHVVRWPEDGVLKVPVLNEAKRAYTLGSAGSNLKVKQYADRVEISVPPEAPDDVLPVVALEFKGELCVHPVPTAGKTGKASSAGEGSPVSNLFDENTGTTWMGAPGESKAWIEVDLEKEILIGNIILAEPMERRKKEQEFLLQYKKDGNWIDIISARTGNASSSREFNPVKARYFRLNITGSDGDVPILSEWVLNRAF
jgi:alpha-L-fucosidase